MQPVARWVRRPVRVWRVAPDSRVAWPRRCSRGHARRTSANMPRQRRPGLATLQVNVRTLNTQRRVAVPPGNLVSRQTRAGRETAAHELRPAAEAAGGCRSRSEASPAAPAAACTPSACGGRAGEVIARSAGAAGLKYLSVPPGLKSGATEESPLAGLNGNGPRDPGPQAPWRGRAAGVCHGRLVRPCFWIRGLGVPLERKCYMRFSSQKRGERSDATDA